MHVHTHINIMHTHTHTNTRALIAGGGAPEIEVALRLMEHSQTLKGMEAYCMRAFAEAMEVIPSTLAENAGLNPISVVTELRKRHANGERTAGINVRKVGPYLSLSLSLSPTPHSFPIISLASIQQVSSLLPPWPPFLKSC